MIKNLNADSVQTRPQAPALDAEAYIQLISERGDRYGGHGGALDLLVWCNKLSLRDVTADEARRFYEDPGASHGDADSAPSDP